MAASVQRGGKNLPQNASLEVEDQKQFNKKVKKIKKNAGQNVESQKSSNGKGVIWLANIPYGFFESEMRAYFSQFGKVTRLKLLRDKKNGKSRGIAFIEFANREVAQIARDSMHNYLMFDKLLKCRVLKEVKPGTFKPDRTTTWAAEKKAMMERSHEPKSEKSQAKKIKKFLDTFAARQKKLQELGIDYTLENLDELREQMTKLRGDTVKKNRARRVRRKALKAKYQKLKNSAEKAGPDTEETKEPATPSPPKVSKTPGSSKKGHPTVDTPKGKQLLLMEDSSDDDISFRTPPLVMKSSRLSEVQVQSLMERGISPRVQKASTGKGQVTPKVSQVANKLKTPQSGKKLKADIVSAGEQSVKTPKRKQEPGRVITPGKTPKAKTPVQTNTDNIDSSPESTNSSKRKRKSTADTPELMKKQKTLSAKKTPKAGVLAVTKQHTTPSTLPKMKASLVEKTPGSGRKSKATPKTSSMKKVKTPKSR